MATADGIYKRAGRRNLYLRFRHNGTLYRRSAGTTDQRKAAEMRRLYVLQVQRRGDPLRAPRCAADFR